MALIKQTAVELQTFIFMNHPTYQSYNNLNNLLMNY